MTSREHARRLMLILLSSQPGSDTRDDRDGEPAEDRQAPDGRDDSTDGDERRTSRLVDALTLA
jgi:hypothetical protein